MIPKFPNFKKLELSDKIEVEKITHKNKPYSDFNFTSMWSWDVNNEKKISELNGNLVVIFKDYLSDDKFYSFLGNNFVTDTVKKLLELSKKENLRQELRFVSEEAINELDSELFEINEDRDHFDYILDNKILTKYEGRDLRGHASFKRRFMEMHSDYINLEILNLDSEDNRDHMFLLNKTWTKNKITEEKDVIPNLEEKVMRRMFELEQKNEHFIFVALFHDSKIVAFTLDEILPNNFSIRHFMKADVKFKGIYSYLISESARILLDHGVKYTNIEQDLGLKNLRQSKKSFKPKDFLKKYTIKPL